MARDGGGVVSLRAVQPRERRLLVSRGALLLLLELVVFVRICDVLPRTPLLPVRIGHLGFGRVDVIVDAVRPVLPVVVAVVHVGLRRRQLQLVLLRRVGGLAEVEIR